MIIAFLDDAVPKAPHWWEIVTGILAIPAAIIGLRYTYQLTQKTRLEITKTELEIEEKRRTLGEHQEVQSPIQAPSWQGSKITEFLILRFIILYLFTRLWGLAEDIVRNVFRGGAYLIVEGLNLEKPLDNLTNGNVGMYSFVAASKIPDVLYWLFTFALAWPLFKDVNRALGLKFVDYLPWRKRP